MFGDERIVSRLNIERAIAIILTYQTLDTGPIGIDPELVFHLTDIRSIIAFLSNIIDEGIGIEVVLCVGKPGTVYRTEPRVRCGALKVKSTYHWGLLRFSRENLLSIWESEGVLAINEFFPRWFNQGGGEITSWQLVAENALGRGVSVKFDKMSVVVVIQTTINIDRIFLLLLSFVAKRLNAKVVVTVLVKIRVRACIPHFRPISYYTAIRRINKL